MPDGLKRYYGRGDLHFVTFRCCRRLDLLRTKRARTLFVGTCASAASAMPNHVHVLMSEPAQGTVSTVLQMLKQRVSRKMRKRKKRGREGQLTLGFDAGGEELRSFWQARFYDFNVYSRGKVKEKLNYMHANPVIRKLVKHPKDWPWSSWSNYMRGGAGLIEIDAVL
jgi:putative transposase